VGMAFCLPPSSTIPTGRSTMSLLTRLKASSLMTVPSILEDIADELDGMDLTDLVGLDLVAVGGGAIKPSVGKKLHASGVKLVNHYGATEIGALAPIFKPDEEYDWTYLRLRTDIGLKLEYLPSDGDGHGQSKDDINGKLPRRCKLIGYPFGWGSAFELQDELECNPLHPDSEVKILGRRDDLIVLATGEKVLPRLIEDSLAQSPLIKTAIAFGDGQFELGVIIEPTVAEEARDHDEFVESIWPLVLAANESMDNHARVSSKTAIIVKPEYKIIPRSDKGSPMRKEVYALFHNEIDAVYEKLNYGPTCGVSMRLDVHHLEKDLQEMVQCCLHHTVAAGTWSIEDDFFELGMDSLQATRLLRVLVASIANGRNAELSSVNVARDFVYSHPSISKMASALRYPVDSGLDGASRRTTLMENLVRQHTLDVRELPLSKAAGAIRVVLLTGSTGNLGAHVLEQLCKDTRVHRVVCFNRGRRVGGHHPDSLPFKDSGLRARQEQVNASRRIFLPATAWSKVEFIHWDAGANLLGLESQEYSRLSLAITHIFHCAWPMDFKRKLQSFEPQIRGVKSLIELAATAHRARPHLIPRVIFASSIAVVGQYSLVAKKTLVPESAMHNPSVTVPMGYAEAKWVCERIMENAVHSRQGEIQPIVVRIGQISGSARTGYWNENEHVPALVKASQVIGHFPDLRGVSILKKIECVLTVQSILRIGCFEPDRNLEFFMATCRPFRYNTRGHYTYPGAT